MYMEASGTESSTEVCQDLLSIDYFIRIVFIGRKLIGTSTFDIGRKQEIQFYPFIMLMFVEQYLPDLFGSKYYYNSSWGTTTSLRIHQATGVNELLCCVTGTLSL